MRPNLPLLSIAQITTATASLRQDVALYADAGVGGIGVWEYKLLADQNPREALQIIVESGLPVTTFVPVGNSVFPTPFDPEPADPVSRVDALVRRMPVWASLRPQCVVLVTGCPEPVTDKPVEKCAYYLHRLAEAASKIGLRLAVEPVHPQAAGFSVVSTLSGVRRLLAEADHPALGLLVDTWHLRDDAEVIRDLRHNAKDVLAVQVADVRPDQRSWADRTIPGRGVLNLRAILAAVRDGGYRGAFEVEIFSDDGRYGQRFPDSLWLLPPAVLVNAVVEATDALGLPLAVALGPKSSGTGVDPA